MNLAPSEFKKLSLWEFWQLSKGFRNFHCASDEDSGAKAPSETDHFKRLEAFGL